MSNIIEVNFPKKPDYKKPDNIWDLQSSHHDRVVELDDGSKPYTTIDSSYLRQHLSDLDLGVIHQHEANGISFSHLTESQVVDMFL